MNSLFNNDFNLSMGTFSDTDILSAFRSNSGANTTIKPGMSAKEISEVVSNKVLAVVKSQFEATKMKFNSAKKD